MRKMRIGIPTNEKVFPVVNDMLWRSDIKLQRNPKEFFVQTAKVEYVFARMSEIIRFVSRGKLDAAFVTRDHWKEWHCHGQDCPPTLREFPDLCTCDVALVARRYYRFPKSGFKRFGDLPEEEDAARFMEWFARAKTLSDKNDTRIVVATRFPTIARMFLWLKKGIGGTFFADYMGLSGEPITLAIREVYGNEELHILMGAADLAIVQVETGETLRRHGLFIVEPVLHSCLIAVGQRHSYAEEIIANLH